MAIGKMHASIGPAVTRREFVAAIATGLTYPVAWPIAARAQNGAAPARVRSPPLERLRELGIRPDGPVEVLNTFRMLIDEGHHSGAQLAVYREGQLAYSIVGGFGRRGGQLVDEQTIFQIRSVTKALAVLVMMRLVEQGRLELDRTVSHYWPEFAQHGKSEITVRSFLGHRAGIPDGPQVPANDLANFDRVATAVAGMTPIWKPGSQNGYHAATMGMVCDELCRRISGSPVHALFEREFKSALALPNLFIGLPPAAFSRMAPMEVDPAVRSTQALRARLSDFINSPAGSAMPLSWVGGFSNAVDLARLFGILALGGSIDRRDLVSEKTIGEFARPTNEPGVVDRRLQFPVRWGAGLILGDTPDIYGSRPDRARLGHAGGGASVAWADPGNRLAVAFLCNRMTARESWERYRRIADAVYGSLA